MLFNATVLSLMKFLERAFSPIMILLLIGCGLLLIMVDQKGLSRQGLSAEAVLARVNGWFYLIGGPVIYLWIKLYFYFAP